MHNLFSYYDLEAFYTSDIGRTVNEISGQALSFYVFNFFNKSIFLSEISVLSKEYNMAWMCLYEACLLYFGIHIIRQTNLKIVMHV